LKLYQFSKWHTRPHRTLQMPYNNLVNKKPHTSLE
jgi:hypothetical protein